MIFLINIAFLVFFNFSNFAEKISIAFSGDHFYPFVGEPAFVGSDFLAALGGLLGLFAGISVISAIEVVFHFLRLLVAKMTDRRLLKVHRMKANERSIVFSPSVSRRRLQYFVEIILKSDIHGIGFLVEGGRKVWEKVFWALIFFLSTIFCSLEIYELVRYSEVNPIEFGIDENIWTINDASRKF